ncbi:MAG: sorbosone dehydrogenase family protein [Thermoanaerobaculia bacterium]|nr:sorbosone dehydrogenase family protein [Thermoanaerobaculia bacterium]
MRHELMAVVSGIVAIFILTIVAGTASCQVVRNPAATDAEGVKLDQIELPPGFEIEIWAGDVPNARSMTMGDDGTLFVGTRRGDEVYGLADTDGDGRPDTRYTVGSGLNTPNGVAFRDGDLYVAEIDRILRYDDIESQLSNAPEPVVISDEFPSDRHHGWKYIAFGPEGKLWVPVGAPCNVCLEEEPYASITRMNPDGSELEVYAEGVRNTVGFAWHPETGELWFTDNGRDMMGDDVPPDELNRAPEPGMHFGYPFCHGGDIPDPKFGERRPCSEFTPPVQKLGPHVAALGMIFYTGEMFPEADRGHVLIAEHGSWNRSVPIGYRVTMVELDGNDAVSYEPFASGWLQGEEAWGRPVDLLQLGDGSVLVSDDFAGAIYRISYEKE